MGFEISYQLKTTAWFSRISIWRRRMLFEAPRIRCDLVDLRPDTFDAVSDMFELE